MLKGLSLLFFFVLTNLTYAESAKTLTPAQRDLLHKVEKHLNSIRTLKAKFVQITDRETRNGTLKWLRPHYIRLDYTGAPFLQLSCDGDFFTQKDNEGEISEYSVSGSPAELLLKPSFNFEKDGYLKQIAEINDLIMIEVSGKNDPQGPSLTLIFKQNPIELSQWKMIDAGGTVTDVILVDPDYQATLSKKEFILK